MWTRLFYLTAKQAFKGEFKDGRFVHRALSGRYTGVLKKQFRIQNVPWTFTKQLDDSKNPRHKKPKGHKVDKIKEMRVSKIMKNIETADAEILKNRQERLNKRKLTGKLFCKKGIDWIIKQTIPSFMAQRSTEKKNVALQWNAKSKKKKGDEDY